MHYSLAAGEGQHLIGIPAEYDDKDNDYIMLLMMVATQTVRHVSGTLINSLLRI